MRLAVHRNGRLVGYLKVIEVDAQEAAGLMVNTVLQAKQGDKVTANPKPRRATKGP